MVNNLIKRLTTLFVFVFCLSFLGAGVFAVNVVLSEQNPDPVSPGNLVYVSVKVSDTTTSGLQNVRVKFIENDIMKLASGENAVKNIGSVDSTSTIVKYQVLVSENAPLGSNVARFDVESNGNLVSYEFPIIVQDSSASLQVKEVKISVVEAGKSSGLSLKLYNPSSVSLKNVVVSLSFNDVEDKVLSTTEGSNAKIIPLIPAGSEKEVVFDLAVSPEASAKPYILPIDLTYEDSLGNLYNDTILSSVRVYSVPILSLKLDSQESFLVGTSKFTFSIANPGTSSIKGTRISILPGEEYEVLEGEYTYVGDLNPDDFQTVQSKIFVESQDLETISLRVEYLDSYNTPKVEELKVPVKIFSEEEAVKYNLSGKSSGGSGIFIYLISIVLIVVAYLIGRRRGFKRGRKSSVN